MLPFFETVCMRKIITCLLLLIVLLQHARAQSPAFYTLTVEEGLASNSVLSVSQDGRGFLWYGTNNGLNRYDGREFRVYRNAPGSNGSLIHNNVSALLNDRNNELWIGTGGGLNRYLPQTDSFERIKPLVGKVIYCLYQDRANRVWAGTNDGLFFRDVTTGVFNRFQWPSAINPGDNVIRCVLEDSRQNLWVGTHNGLLKLIYSKGAYRVEILRHNAADPHSISADYVTCLAEDSMQQLWVGTENGGLNLLNPSTQQFTRFLSRTNNSDGLINNHIRKVLVTRDGKLWVGTQEGVTIVDPHTKKMISCQHEAGNKKSLSQNSVHSLFQDNNGSIWVGTYFGGINVHHATSTPFNTIQTPEKGQGLSNNVISGIVEDNNQQLWICTEGGGLNVYDPRTGAFTVLKNKVGDNASLGSNLVKAIYRDRDGNLWVGTHGGGLNLVEENGKRFRRYLYSATDPGSLLLEVVTMLDDSSGRFWAGTNQGLKIFRRIGSRLQDESFLQPPEGLGYTIRTIIADASNNIWLGTPQGLWCFKGNQFRQALSNVDVNCLYTDQRGILWVGLNGGGLIRYDPITGKKEQYTNRNGLADNLVVGILSDEHRHLWISTNNGLVQFNPEKYTWQTYYTSDGLAGNRFNNNSFFRDSRGNFYFGGFNGITVFTPGNIATNNYQAPVYFTGLKLFNTPVAVNGKDKLLKQDISQTKQIEFHHDQNIFTISFALLSYVRSNKNRYAYMLENFDKTWNEGRSNTATYRNLPPGNYRLLVKGANNDGVWSKVIALDISVLPPLWLTWWAYTLYAVLLGAILFFVFRYFFLRALLRKENELHQLKLNFFTNVSHEIRTHITLIAAPIEKIADHVNDPAQVQYHLNAVKNNTNRLLRLVNELMDFRKAETQHLKLHVAADNLTTLLEEVYRSFQELAQSRRIHFSLLYEEEQIPLYYDREQLEKVFFNLLINAFKFTPDGGRIAIQATREQDRVLVKVTDNGRGIAPQYLDKLFTNYFQIADHGVQNTGYGIGLALSRHIMELHHGAITVESKPSSGQEEGFTCFTVSLLTGSSHLSGSHFGVKETVFENVPPPEVPAVENKIIPEEKSPASTHPFHILIAEDNPALQQLIRDIFKDNYQLSICDNGLDAWRSVTEQIPDLVISDVMMPDMDGFTLCAKLKTDERTSHIPIILLTARTSQADQISGLEQGADLYLTKPFSTKILQLQAGNLLTGREKMRLRYSQQINTANLQLDSGGNVVQPAFQEMSAVDQAFLANLVKLIEEHMADEDFGVDMLSRKVAMSAPVLYKKLKALINMSVNDFVKSIRLQRAAAMLMEKKHTVYEVAFAVGYNDRKHFAQEFKKKFGVPPSEFAARSAV